ncbi:hypothetical protein [Carboxylicivirga sp. M1479]|uniref:hypothetical protein n=1 Tax=Carboxylicivirga sp. M1479 TaxID=2594476 RepID=UPI001177B7E9|nr:hypothetical protein [Carboxylicivirga sp. M1479]TRX66304.1 hypothetical protein FNN09_13935 [Carboxylicivirga sp. M1479]
MSKVNFTFTVKLDDNEFIRVDEHLYTTRSSLQGEELKIHVLSKCCLKVLKNFEGQLTQPVIEEWLLLSKALDQSCSYESQWDDKKILKELIAGSEHPVSWYANHCRVS